MAAFLSLFFLGITVFCGVLAFGDSGVSGPWVHAGFVFGMIGFVSFTVSVLARWAASTLDDVPGQRGAGSRSRDPRA